MAVIVLDTKGLRCPQPVLRVAAKMPEIKPGDVLEIEGDCPTFEEDMRNWCKRMRKTLLAVTIIGKAKRASIQF